MVSTHGPAPTQWAAVTIQVSETSTQPQVWPGKVSMGVLLPRRWRDPCQGNSPGVASRPERKSHD